MTAVTAETTLRFLRKNEPSFIIDYIVNTRSRHVGKDRSAKAFIPSIDSIYSFSVIDWIVELLSIDFIIGAVDYKDIIKSDVVREVVDGWIYG